MRKEEFKRYLKQYTIPELKASPRKSVMSGG